MIAEIVLSTGTKLQYCFKIVFNFKRHPQHDYYIGLSIILKKKKNSKDVLNLCCISKATLNVITT